MTEIQCIQTANAILGEGPVWDSRAGILYWVDIKRPAVYRFDPRVGQTGHWPMSRPVGCIAPTRSAEHLIFADTDGVGLLNLTTGLIVRIADVEQHQPHNRFNDGKVDPNGNLWAGTMHEPCKEPTGSLYRLSSDGTVRQAAAGFTCSNGLGWSPDGSTMYLTDSVVRTIWAYDCDLDRGELGERRAFATLAQNDGLPDGLTVDVEGGVWSAIWDGGRLIRFALDGTIDREVRLPVKRPTSCTFGGPDLKTLYITSASVDLDAQTLLGGPLAGGLFALKCDVPGQKAIPFGG